MVPALGGKLEPKDGEGRRKNQTALLLVPTWLQASCSALLMIHLTVGKVELSQAMNPWRYLYRGQEKQELYRVWKLYVLPFYLCNILLII